VALSRAVSTYLAENEVECPPTTLVTPAVKTFKTDNHSTVLVSCVGR
jgi:hypothetical protein